MFKKGKGGGKEEGAKRRKQIRNSKIETRAQTVLTGKGKETKERERQVQKLIKIVVFLFLTFITMQRGGRAVADSNV